MGNNTLSFQFVETVTQVAILCIVSTIETQWSLLPNKNAQGDVWSVVY